MNSSQCIEAHGKSRKTRNQGVRVISARSTSSQPADRTREESLALTKKNPVRVLTDMLSGVLVIATLFACLALVGCGVDNDDNEDLSQNRPPYVGLTHKTVVKQGDSIVFNAERSGDLDLDDFIAEYNLLPGDGSPLIKSSSPILYHTFEQAGTFAVRLTVFDPEGAKSSLDSQITVIQSGIVACTQDETCPFGSCRDGFCSTKRCSHDEACPFSGRCEDGECDE